MLTKKPATTMLHTFLFFSVSNLPFFFSFFRFRATPIEQRPPSPRARAMTSSADRINLAELTSQLANAEARVCEWASAAGKRADAARLEHGRRIAALRGEVLPRVGYWSARLFEPACSGEDGCDLPSCSRSEKEPRKREDQGERLKRIQCFDVACFFLDDDNDERRKTSTFCSNNSFGKQQQKPKTTTETVSRLEAKREDIARRAGELRTRE